MSDDQSYRLSLQHFEDMEAEIERLRAALKKALPVLEVVGSGGTAPLKQRQAARLAVSLALGGSAEQSLPPKPAPKE